MTEATPTDNVDDCRCEELLEHLYEFVDSEMSENDVARLRRHVADCHTCREATDMETKVRLLLRRLRSGDAGARGSTKCGAWARIAGAWAPSANRKPI